MPDTKESLIGGVVVKTLTYKEQAYELIKDAVLFNRFRVSEPYTRKMKYAKSSVSAERLYGKPC